MFRALRLDKLIYQALETTLRSLLLERWTAIPALHMIAQTSEEIRERAEGLLALLRGAAVELVRGQSVAGGGSTPEQFLDTWLIAVTCDDVVEAERRCRASDPPVIARIEQDRLVFDLRTVFPAEEPELVRAIAASISG